MLNERELGAVLTGLRFLQEAESLPPELEDILRDGGEPLSKDEVDQLCERLNTDPLGLSILESAWKPSGPRWNEQARLIAEVAVNGTCCVGEAIEVTMDGNGCQVAAERTLNDDFISHHVTFEADGPFQTAEIAGREYAIFLYPANWEMP